MIRIKNLSKTYDTKVLDNISLNLYAGNIYVLKGISGSGKTTLLNIISGLDNNYEGQVTINENDISKLNEKEKQNFKNNIGYMLQKSLLYRKLTILENLLLIENDKDHIIDLSKQFGIYDILDKYPNKISGGERQRVSLIRTLLNNNKILILDEPTSNLDYQNSIIFVEFLKKIDKKDKIIIISTHKDIFDNIADILINIDYGKIKTKVINENKEELKLCTNSNEKKIIRNAFKSRKKISLFMRIFISFMFLISFLAIAFNLNFKREFINYKLNDTPYNVLDINDKYVHNLQNIITEVYDSYQYKEENFVVYPLLKKEYTNLQKLIVAGNWPKSDNEVLINNFFAGINFNGSKYQDIIGKKIKINNKEFLISGVVSISKNDILNLNKYYNDLSTTEVVFLDYNQLKTFGQEGSSEYKMVVFDSKYLLDIYSNSEFDYMFSGSTSYFFYKNEVANISMKVIGITQISFIIIVVVSMLTLLFLTNQISLELYYRKKEIGYLQLFHFDKDDISWFIILEYVPNFLISLLVALLIYFLLSIIILFAWGINIFINVFVLLLINLIFILYIYLIIKIPLNRYLKKDIIDLLR